jgi:N-acyl-D-amino-acid deacylase
MPSDPDILIKNGTIFDGTGRLRYKADIYIKDKKIQKISRRIKEKAEIVIDATGLAVAPGFWDLHAHDDFVIAVKNHPDLLECKVRSGITTVVCGNCGYSPYPVSPKYFEDLKLYVAFLDAGLTWEWRNLREYFNFLERQGIIVNFATHVGQGAIRTAVMGLATPGPANKEQLEEMKSLLRQEMEAGAFGMTCGLLYPPGLFTPTEELVELAKVVAEYGGVVGVHMRNESELMFEAVSEVIRIGQESGARVHIHHLEAFGEKYFWKMPVVLNMLNEAREVRGVEISYDFIPSTGDNTTIMAMFPMWAFEGGFEKFVERVKDPKLLAKMREEAERYLPTWPPLEVYPHNVVKASAVDSKRGWDNIQIIWCKTRKEFEGLTLRQLGEKMGKHPFDAAAELAVEEKGAVMCVYFGGSGTKEEEWVYGGRGPSVKLPQVKDPFSSIETDAILGKERQVPVAWGMGPMVIGRMARDEGWITMEEAIKKITFNPAHVLRVDDRGVIHRGAYADIVIFDPKTIIDRATYEEAKPPVGIEYVIINGTIVVEKGEYYKDRRPGMIIRSTDYY